MKTVTQQDVDRILVEMKGNTVPLTFLADACDFARRVEQHVFGNKILTTDTILEEWFYLNQVHYDRQMIVFATNLQRIIEQKVSALCY